MKTRFLTTNTDFTCRRCGHFVSANSLLSGTQNRNHCPYCLWSRHLDLFCAGDRLSACKGLMQPYGLTVKASAKKYGSGLGELMLVHRCLDCGDLSINRIAADDDPDRLLEIHRGSFALAQRERAALRQGGIDLLGRAHASLIEMRLFGAPV